MKKVLKKEFTNSFAQSIGLEGANQLFTEALQSLHLPDQEEYTKEEAITICKQLKKQPGFIGIVAGILLSRFILR